MNKNNHTVFLALGTNLGNKEENIERAIKLLQKQVHVIQRAPLYESKPKGYSNQDNFVNSALRGETNLTPHELLSFVKSIERDLGRVKRMRNGPREIDIDILFYDDLIIDTPNLIIPHPRIAERDFVLMPLIDLDETFIHPTLKISMQRLFNDFKGEHHVISNKS